MGFRIEAPKQDGNARFDTLKVNLNENNSATRTVVSDEEGNFYYGAGGGGGTAGTNGTSGVNGTSGTSGTGFNTISNPQLGRVLLSDGSTNSAIAATNLNFLNDTLQVTGSLIADTLLINSDVFEFTGSLRVLGGITGSLQGTASWAINALTSSFVTASNVYGPYGSNSIISASNAATASSADTFIIRSDKFEFTGSLEVLGGITGSLLGTASFAITASHALNVDGTASWAYNALTASSADDFIIRADKFEFTGSVQVLGGITGSLYGTSSWAVSASWAPTAAQSDTASYVSSSNVYGPYGFDSIQTASFALTASSADSFVIRSDVFEFTGSVRVLGSITGSLLGTASFAITASHALNVPATASYALVASASAITDTTTGTGPYYLTFVDGTSGNRPLRVDSNTLTFNATTNVLTATASNAITASTAATASSADTFVIRSDVFEFTGSVRVLGSITGSLLGTSSFAITASHALNVPVTASHALVASSSVVTDTTTGTGPFYLTFVDGTTGNRPLRVDSNTLTFNASTNILTATASQALTASSADNFFVRQNITASNALINNTLTAQTLVVQTITSSIIYSSGSNIFGNQLSNIHQFTGSLRVTGSVTATDFILGTNLFAARRYVATINSISEAGYTNICNVVGNSLASAVRITFQGTANSVVVNTTADILVNHFEDIYVKSESGIYTLLTIRIISDNNDSFTVQATTNSANAVNLNIEVFPLNSETVVFSAAALSGATLTHVCYPGMAISATGGADGNFRNTGTGTFGNKVGINGVPPTYPLYVKTIADQNFRVVDGGSGFTQLSVINDAETTYQKMMFGNSWLNILNTGEVGIGTDTPSTLLHLKKDQATLTSIRVDNANLTSDGGVSLKLYRETSNIRPAYVEYGNVTPSTTWYGGILYNAGNANTVWSLSTADSLVSSLFNINTSGNVGIDAVTPAAKLQIGTSISDTGTQKVRIAQAYSANNVVDALHVDHQGAGIWADGVAISIGYKSSVYGSYTSRIVNYLNTATTTATRLQLQTQAGGGTTWNTGILIDDTGKVGVGTTGPAYALDVLGTIRATGDVIAYSDARVKDNVETITGALSKVKSLRGVSYTRNDSEDKSLKIGIIAQEVLKVLPEVVQQDDEGKYSVAYGNMVGLLIEAIKEQQQQIEELKYLLKKD
jgi:hypothetical protein